MEFWEILYEIMYEKDLTVAQVAKACDLRDSTVRSILDRKQKKVALNVAFKLSRGLGVSLFRLDGQEEPEEATSPTGEPAPWQNEPPLSLQARQVAAGFDRLDERGKGAVWATLDYEFSAQQQYPDRRNAFGSAMPKAYHREDGFVELDVFLEPAAAGLGNYLDSPTAERHQYPSFYVPEKTDFGIKISGDSMQPKIFHGATVFVQSMPAISDGQIGIFVLNGLSYCKMLKIDTHQKQVRLVSLNRELVNGQRKYPDMIISPTDDFRTLGLVLDQFMA